MIPPASSAEILQAIGQTRPIAPKAGSLSGPYGSESLHSYVSSVCTVHMLTMSIMTVAGCLLLLVHRENMSMSHCVGHIEAMQILTVLLYLLIT